MGTIKNISRRSFVKSVGLASGGLILACNTSVFSNKEKEPKNLIDFNPNLFVQLNSDGSFTYSLILSFPSKEIQDKYQAEPVHVKFVEESQHLWERVVVYDSVGI